MDEAVVVKPVQPPDPQRCIIQLTQQTYNHWRQVGEARGLTSDTDIASFLLHQ